MRNRKNIRTCLGCMKKSDKKDFYRIANIDGEILLDINQNLGGRGSYICSIKCLEKAKENNFLDKRLRKRLSEENITEIINKMKS